MASAHDLDILARTINGEARGETPQGRLAVGWVAVNRSRYAQIHGRKQFGDGTIAGACLAPMQFSSWNADDPNRPKMLALSMEDSLYQVALYAALGAALGMEADPTQGCLFYFADSIPTPVWAEGKDYLSIGHHKFIKDA